MTERFRIRKTPIREAIKNLGVAWEGADRRVRGLTAEQFRAVHPEYGVHPFKDKLRIEGMMEGLKFALTGHSEAVEFWLKEPMSIEDREVQSPVEPTITEPRVPFTIYVTGLVNRLFPMPRSNQ